jgi:acyl-CoA thioester hydrolase
LGWDCRAVGSFVSGIDLLGIYNYELTVPQAAIDGNGHVNNVDYLRWMLDAATAHADAVGGTGIAEQFGATWFVKSHRIDYLRPAFLDDNLVIQTWVASVSRVRSTRKYRIVRGDEPLVVGETDWVFVDVETGRPRIIPQDVMDCFVVVEA